MGLFDRAVVTGGKAFGHIGSVVKRFGHIGGKAVKIAGDIANGVNAVYNKANDASRGALGELIRTVPGGASALHYGGKALGVYNRLAPHAHQFLTQRFGPLAAASSPATASCPRTH